MSFSHNLEADLAGYLLLAIVAFSLIAYFVGQSAGRQFVATDGNSVHSLPGFHGAFVAVWVGMPALVLLVLWIAAQGGVVDSLVMSSLPAEFVAGKSPAELSLVLSEIRNVAANQIFAEPSPAVRAAADALVRWNEIGRWAMVAVVFSVMIIALLLARRLLAPRFRARNAVERVLSGLMIACSVAAILTTVGIIASLVYESLEFFRMVPIQEFLFGLRWEPQIAIRADQVAGAGAFGAVPVFVGTLLISAIAMLVAVPIGLFTAIFLVEYASDTVRNVVKPILEILAGVPTVVYGFFAVLTVAPAIRQAGGLIGLGVSPNSALAAGLVMGVMIIPFVSSLADDALKAVPRSMRDGSLAMGATRAETMTRVLLPAALPGIMGGILLALSRAIGETMIVVMAAGLIASLTVNPIDSVTTVTVQIVTLLIGDTSFDSPKTLAAFALGLVLFLVTLALNVLALNIVRKFREQYD
jgi:phosphate transport system permease protein